MRTYFKGFEPFSSSLLVCVTIIYYDDLQYIATKITKMDDDKQDDKTRQQKQRKFSK